MRLIHDRSWSIHVMISVYKSFNACYFLFFSLALRCPFLLFMFDDAASRADYRFLECSGLKIVDTITRPDYGCLDPSELDSSSY